MNEFLFTSYDVCSKEKVISLYSKSIFESWPGDLSLCLLDTRLIRVPTAMEIHGHNLKPYISSQVHFWSFFLISCHRLPIFSCWLLFRNNLCTKVQLNRKIKFKLKAKNVCNSMIHHYKTCTQKIITSKKKLFWFGKLSLNQRQNCLIEIFTLWKLWGLAAHAVR